MVRVLALLLLWPAAAPAQQPVQQPVQGLVYAPGARLLGDAEVSFHAGRATAPDWLTDPGTAPEPLRARSDDRGRFRIAGADRTGCLLVTHPSGLGALLPGVAPGAPERVRLQPLAEVRLRASDAPFTAHVAAAVGEGDPLYLGSRAGDRLRLPPGRYRLLLRCGEGWADHTVHLTEGRRVELPVPPVASRAVRLPADFDGEVLLADWPAVPLPRAPLRLPTAEGPLVLRVVQRDGPDLALSSLWVDPGDPAPRIEPSALAWRPLLVVGPDGAPVPGARVYTVANAARGPVAVAVSTTDAAGRARHAAVDDGSAVLVQARGLGFRLVDRDRLEPGRIALALGHGVEVRVTERGGEAAGVPVELRHTDHPALVFAAHTDRRGRARFADLPPGRATVHLRSAAHLPVSRNIAIPGDPGELRADAGAEVRGRVRLEDGSPAAGAAVQLRDTAGDFALRAVAADADGRFAFSGLSPDHLFTVSAEVQRDGRTWSAQLRGVQPGDGESILQLRLEDPRPPHRRR